MSLFFEVPSGTVVEPRMIHTVLTGITQHGKTEVIKSLVEFYHSQGYTVLIVDVKDKTLGKPDFAAYAQIPIYLEEVRDPLSLLGLLESNAKMKLKFQFPELIKACQRSSTLRGIRDELDAVITGGKIHPVRKDKAEVLKLVLDSLLEEIDRIEKSDTLQIKLGEINCMNLSNQGFSDAFKQIAVRSVIKYVRMNLSKIFVVFDEAHIQIPQGYSSASKQWIVKTIKEGASSKQFLLIADQTIKEIDKNVVSQCHFKIFGGQAGGQLEAKRTYDYMPVKSGVTQENIMRLGLGHFYVCTRDWTKLCYALPRGVPMEMGIRVAKGKLTAEYIRDTFMVKTEKEEDDEMVYKEKFEKLEQKYQELLDRFQKAKHEVTKEVRTEFEGKLTEANDMIKALRVQNEEMREANLDKYHLELENTQKELAAAKKQLLKLEPLKKLREALLKILPSASNISALAKQGLKIKLGTSFTEISVKDMEPQQVVMTTKKPSGKLMFCATKIHNRKVKADPKLMPLFTSADLQKEALEYGWRMANRTVGGALMVMVRDGHFIQEGKKYRLPSKVKINVK